MAKDGEPRHVEHREDENMGTGRARAPLSDRSSFRVPSMSALIAFESAARLGSFSHAARELGTSQSAISRYIARLESQLSARLFERSRIGVSLTDAGLRFREAVLLALGALRDAAAEIAEHSGEDGTGVAIACPGELSHLFVMQRYDALKAALGDHVRIHILAHNDAAAPAPPEAAADVLLSWDAGTAAPKHRVTIAMGAVDVFCSPGYAAAHAQVLNGPAAGWGGLTLFDLAGPDEGGASWERWFEAVGRPASCPRYEVVASHAQALEAAVAGRGLALGWRHLIGRHARPALWSCRRAASSRRTGASMPCSRQRGGGDRWRGHALPSSAGRPGTGQAGPSREHLAATARMGRPVAPCLPAMALGALAARFCPRAAPLGRATGAAPAR